MSDHPLMFSGPMIQALLAGKKSVTRRCPPNRYAKWRKGDRVWVRETFCARYFDNGGTAYRADWTSRAAEVCAEPKWKPAIHMPRSASRITLELTEDVMVQRLDDIQHHEIRAEGFTCPEHEDYPNECIKNCPSLRDGFAAGWNIINGERDGGKYRWWRNPEVAVILFRRIDT